MKGDNPRYRAAIAAVAVAAVSAGLIWLLGGADAPSPNRYDPLIHEAAQRHGIDPLLVKAVIRQESAFDADARGDAGEVGLMQITRAAASDWERVNDRHLRSAGSLFTPQLNVEVGTWYLAQALRRWRSHDETEVMALIQYNAGPGRARQWAAENSGQNMREQIPFPSTRAYIAQVLKYHDDYTKREGIRSHR
jgi:soluble lytic murein transglycosylase